MGDSGAEDTSDSLTESDLDQIASDAEAIQEGGKSNIVGSSSYDAQFTADNLESRGLDPENFMAPENFAQTTQGGFTGGTGPQETTINVPSIGAASSTLAPGILGETLSDFQSGVRQDTPANQMLEAAIGTTVPIPNVSRETVVDNRVPGINEQLLSGLRTTLGNVQDAGRINKQMQDALVFGGINPDDTLSARRVDDPRFIDFGVVDKGVTQQNEVTDADTTAASEILAGLFDKDPDSIAARSMPGTAVDLTQGTGTTATGTTRGEDPFDPDVGRAFPVETLERAERLVNEKTALENLGLPGFLSAVDPERVSRDLMATSLIAGRPIGAVEAIRGVQAPNLQKETMEEYRERTGARIPESQIITDDSGLVVGIKDAQGNLVTGMDPNAQEVQGDNDNIVRTKAPPKAPTDPCPDGYQLIDGKCTPTGATDTGTGFMMFPADRDPAFRRGPFTPTTVATTPNIRALNPVTFGLSNIFRR